MNILILSKKIPFPAKDGESIAIINLAYNFFFLGNSVTLLGMRTKKHNYRIEHIPADMKKAIQFHAIEVDTEIKYWDIIKNMFTNVPYHIYRFISKEYDQELKKLLSENSFDIVQLEGLFLVPYIKTIRRNSPAKIILRSHNIEGNIWKLLSVNEKNIFKKLFMQWQSKKLLNYEVAHLKNYDAVVPISLSDEFFYEIQKPAIPIKYIPSGVDEKKTIQTLEVDYNTIYYIGALDWLPNIEGLKWFIEKVYPLIKVSYPKVKFHIAGRNADKYFQSLQIDSVFFHGEIQNANEFIQDKLICIVPVLSGSGMKIKIMEALYNCKYVVTTATGAEGFTGEFKRFMYVSDSEQDFAQAVVNGLKAPHNLLKTGKDAAEYVKHNFDNKILTQQLIDFYKIIV